MKKPSKSLGEALAVLQTINRLLGVQCFERKGKPRRAVSLIYATTLTIVYYILIYFGYDYYLQSKVLKFERIMAVFLMYTNAVAVLILSIFGCFFTQKYKSIIRRIENVDSTLEQLRSPTNNRRAYVRSFQGILSYLSYQIILNYVNESWTLNDYGISSAAYIAVIYVHCQNLSYFVLLTFIILVSCLELRFKRINDLLYEVSTTHRLNSKRQFAGIYGSKLISVMPKLYPGIDRSMHNREIRRRSIHVVRTTKQLHLELCKTSRQLCNCFGFQLLLIMALNVIVITNLLFTLYNRFVTLTVSSMGKLKRMILTFPLCVLYVGQLLILNRTCESASQTAKRSTEIVHELHGLTDDPGTREEVNQFALQLMQSPLEFSPLGFLRLNNNFMHALVGSMTTYAVILIQVGDTWLDQSNDNSSSLSLNFSWLLSSQRM